MLISFAFLALATLPTRAADFTIGWNPPGTNSFVEGYLIYVQLPTDPLPPPLGGTVLKHVGPGSRASITLPDGFHLLRLIATNANGPSSPSNPLLVQVMGTNVVVPRPFPPVNFVLISVP